LRSGGTAPLLMKWLLFALGILALWFANRVFFILVGESRLIYYFGTPTLFLLLCISAVGWVSHKRKRKSVQRPLPWIATWASVGFCIASILAIAAWFMNTNFIRNNAGLLWPFSLGLVALDGHPSILVGLLLVTLMGFINGLYYAFLAAMSWMLLKAFRTELPGNIPK
jgi:hypothetical protein